MEKHLGQLYQQKTKYSRSSLEGRKLDWDNKPDSFKEYGGEYLWCHQRYSPQGLFLQMAPVVEKSRGEQRSRVVQNT